MTLIDIDMDDRQDQAEDEENILCYCEWLTRDEVIAAIPYARDVKDLREQTRVCTVCFGCEGDLDDLVAEHEHEFGTAR